MERIFSRPLAAVTGIISHAKSYFSMEFVRDPGHEWDKILLVNQWNDWLFQLGDHPGAWESSWARNPMPLHSAGLYRYGRHIQAGRQRVESCVWILKSQWCCQGEYPTLIRFCSPTKSLCLPGSELHDPTTEINNVEYKPLEVEVDTSRIWAASTWSVTQLATPRWLSLPLPILIIDLYVCYFYIKLPENYNTLVPGLWSSLCTIM